jgi:hypothetical protein
MRCVAAWAGERTVSELLAAEDPQEESGIPESQEDICDAVDFAVDELGDDNAIIVACSSVADLLDPERSVVQLGNGEELSARAGTTRVIVASQGVETGHVVFGGVTCEVSDDASTGLVAVEMAVKFRCVVIRNTRRVRIVEVRVPEVGTTL